MRFTVSLVLLAGLLATAVEAQDPAEGWMAYAVGTLQGGQRITSAEARWRVPADPEEGGAFFSPWFGIETSDNLNLIQPVNPWVGDGWEIYNEYFQWQPTNNYNSRSISVNAGDEVYGKVTFNEADESYTMVHSVNSTGESVSSTIKVQNDDSGSPKHYNILYFVMEKSQYDCAQYPPDNQVVFYDIKVEYDGKPATPTWKTSFVDDHCNCRAHIVSESSIKITWDSGSGETGSQAAIADAHAQQLHSGVSASLRAAARRDEAVAVASA